MTQNVEKYSSQNNLEEINDRFNLIVNNETTLLIKIIRDQSNSNLLCIDEH